MAYKNKHTIFYKIACFEKFVSKSEHDGVFIEIKSHACSSTDSEIIKMKGNDAYGDIHSHTEPSDQLDEGVYDIPTL